MEPPLVMLIDDSQTVRKIVEVMLKRAGYRFICFVDGVEVLKWLISPDSEVPALLLLDINLPKMDGYQVARHLKSRARFASIPIVMLTRRSGVVDLLKAKVSGACQYMTKPFETEELVEMVSKVLDNAPVPAGSRRSVDESEVFRDNAYD